MTTRITFNNQKNLFFKSLKEKVDNYFAENNISSTGNSKLYIKSIAQVISALIIYITLVFFTPVLPVAIILCCLFGVNMAVIGFNIMHEGGHASFSRHTWLNKISVYFLNALGANSYYWKVKHNINHHTYTNVEGMDSDIDVAPFMRLHEGQRRYKMHKFQHLYCIFLYGFTYFLWVFYQDFQKYFSGKIAEGQKVQPLVFREQVIFWATKIFYVGAYILLPVFMVGLLKALIGFAIVCFTCGLFITIVFQMAHIVEGTTFTTPTADTSKIEEAWAVHQVHTTSNFGTRSRFTSWLMGGLNFQVEHHLFPRVSHVHYPKINQIVKETCAEYNVQYNEYSSFFTALRSHFVLIRELGRA
jgi:linoleoyl-CoA desaturase